MNKSRLKVQLESAKGKGDGENDELWIQAYPWKSSRVNEKD